MIKGSLVRLHPLIHLLLSLSQYPRETYEACRRSSFDTSDTSIMRDYKSLFSSALLKRNDMCLLRFIKLKSTILGTCECIGKSRFRVTDGTSSYRYVSWLYVLIKMDGAVDALLHLILSASDAVRSAWRSACSSYPDMSASCGSRDGIHRIAHNICFCLHKRSYNL